MALFGQIIVIVDPQVWTFEGMIQRFEVTGLGYICTWHMRYY